MTSVTPPEVEPGPAGTSGSRTVRQHLLLEGGPAGFIESAAQFLYLVLQQDDLRIPAMHPSVMIGETVPRIVVLP